MNVFNYVNIVLLLLATTTAIRAGGRYERLLAALLLADTAAAFGVQHFTGQYGSPWLAAEHGLLFVALGWLASRWRSPWMLGVFLAGAAVVALDLVQLSPARLSLMRYLTAVNLLANLQLALLVGSVLRRWFGPPYVMPDRA